MVRGIAALVWAREQYPCLASMEAKALAPAGHPVWRFLNSTVTHPCQWRKDQMWWAISPSTYGYIEMYQNGERP